MNKLQHSEQTIRAATFVEYGVRTSIIVKETGLSHKYVRALAKEITGKSPISGQLAEVTRLIKTKKSLMLSTLLLSIHRKLHTQSLFKPGSEGCFLEQVIQAYEHLEIQVDNLETFSINATPQLITINEAWVLLRSYLNYEIQLSVCTCGCLKLHVIGQKKQACPFCFYLQQSSKSYH
ncbi:FlhC family transcriptional regulator [Parashewanella spongiae]|nr:FlhC family transcriptional regulator [Parashewanella spongiae]MCL1077597.1 FlhC family transcriptional regulator [Parashewanella spongiae]